MAASRTHCSLYAAVFFACLSLGASFLPVPSVIKARSPAPNVNGFACRSASRMPLGLHASIAVFGSTGGVGLETVFQALADGNKVVTLARTPSKLVVPPGSGGETKAGQQLNSPDLTVIEGDVTKADDVAKVFEGGDVEGVVIALGGATGKVGKSMLTDGTRNIISAMKAKGVAKVSVVTSIGTGDSYDQAPFAFKVFMWTILKDAFVDKNNQEELFNKAGGIGSDLEWTLVRPAGLNLGSPTGQIKVITPPEQAGSIPRADVAAFCLRMLKDPAYLRKAACITGGI